MNLNVFFFLTIHQPVLSVLQLATAFCPQVSASLEWVKLDVIPVLKMFNRRRQTFLVLYHLLAIFSLWSPYVTDDLCEAEAYKASKDKLQTELELLQRQMQNSAPFYRTRYKVIGFITSLQHCWSTSSVESTTKCLYVIGSQQPLIIVNFKFGRYNWYFSIRSLLLELQLHCYRRLKI